MVRRGRLLAYVGIIHVESVHKLAHSLLADCTAKPLLADVIHQVRGVAHGEPCTALNGIII